MLMLAGNLGGFALLALRHGFALPRQGAAAYIVWGWVAFLIFSAFGGYLTDVPSARFLRIGMPFLLFLTGVLVALWACRGQDASHFLIRAMLAGAIISMLFTVFWGFASSGAGIGEVRYRILSPLLAFVTVTAATDFVLLRRFRALRVAILCAVALLISLSVTRGVLLTLVFVAIAFLPLIFIYALVRRRVPRSLLAGVAAIVIGGAGALMALYIFAPELWAQWQTRSLGATRYTGFWTRVAGVDGQIRLLNYFPWGWWSGLGFGTRYPWPQDEYLMIAHFLGPTPSRYTFHAGEFMWFPPIFYAGVFGGGVAIGALLVGTYKALALLIQLFANPGDYARMRPAWLGAVGFLAFIGLGFTANPFINRLSALYMGLCLGLVLAHHRALWVRSRSVAS